MAFWEDLKELRVADIATFLTVARCGSVNRAAREVRVSPSQVSKAVSRLERQLGINLLDRSTSGVHVSADGSRILPELESILERLQMIRQREERAGLLTVSGPSYVIAHFLPALAERHGDLHFRGVEMPPSMVRAKLAENVFDMAISLGSQSLPPSWETALIGDVRQVILGRPALLSRLGDPVTPEAIREVPFVCPVFHDGRRYLHVDDDCPLPRHERKCGHEAQTLGLAMEIVAKSDQVVFGMALSARHLRHRGEVVEIPVQGWDVRQPLYLTYNTERILASQQRSFVTTLQERLVELEG